MRMTLILNFFGGPGSGKSTLAAGVFYKLKTNMYNVELVTEFAKDLVWEKRNSALKCQPYIFGQQLHKIERIVGQTDIIVTDSPILLSTIYAQNYPKSFLHSVVDIFQTFNNLNYFIERGENNYDPVGRNESLEQAESIDEKIKVFLNSNNIPYFAVNKRDKDNVEQVYRKATEHLPNANRVDTIWV
jgi:nicotinamide riboside kinase